MIKEVFNDLKYFILVFFLTTMIFAVPITFVNKNQDTLGSMFNDNECADEFKHDFGEAIMYTYLLAIGMEYNDENMYGLAFFIIACFGFIVVMLNLLIAVV